MAVAVMAFGSTTVMSASAPPLLRAWWRLVGAACLGLRARGVGQIARRVEGYYVRRLQRVNGLTPWQGGVVLTVLFVVTVIDVILYRKAASTGEVQWGKMTDRSQYILILLAITFCSMMGLMGYVR